MTDDALDTALSTLQTFKRNVGTLGPNIQAFAQVNAEWSNVQSILAGKALPRLGPSTQLASRAILATITSSMQAIQVSEQMGIQQPAHFRTIWIRNIEGHLAEVEALLQNPPPELKPAQAPPPNDTRSSDLSEAKTLLTSGQTDAERRATDLRRSGWYAHATAIVLALVASVVPFAWTPTGEGWPIVAAWSARLLAVLALVAPAMLLFRLAQDYHVKAMAAVRERSLLQVVAASAYVNRSTDHGGALVDLVRRLSQSPPAPADDGAVVLPAGIIKQLPAILKAFGGSKGTE